MVEARSPILDRQPAAVRAAIEEFARLVRRRFGDAVEEVRLFGSRARGDMRPDSDADVLVVLDEVDWPTRRAVLDIAADVHLKHEVDVAPRILDRETFRTWRRQERPLVMDAVREGIPL